jgi:hypothetical protein
MATIKISQLPPATGALSSSDVVAAVQSGTTVKATVASFGYQPAGTGAVPTTVQAKLRQIVSVTDFGAVCDGTTDDSAAVQLAINYCATFAPYWPTLVIPGRCRLASSVNIDRLVDTTKTEFTILGQGPGAGFYTTGNVTMFDSTLTMGTGPTSNPVSEFVTFENITFETSAYGNDSFILSRKFLRIKFINCFFWLVRCQTSDTYVQTLYFLACNIRNNHVNFINSVGLYDVAFDSCIIENGQTIVRSIDAARGTNGLRFIDNVIEGIGSSIVVATGLSGFNLVGNHIESNFTPNFNFFAGGVTNGSVTVTGNYIYNPSGATFYYGPTTAVFSAGNTVFPNVLHSNAIQITNLISSGDNCSGGISDATTYSTVNGVYRAGNSASAWTDSANQITKSAAGNFGINIAPQVSNKVTIAGKDQTTTAFGLVVYDSAGNTGFAVRNDRSIAIPTLQNYANDAAAAAAGLPVGFLYRNGSVVQVRVT